MSLEEKLRYRAQRHGSVNQGYFPIKETSEIHPDLVEGWVFCRRAFDLGGPDWRALRLLAAAVARARSAECAWAHEPDPAGDAGRSCSVARLRRAALRPAS